MRRACELPLACEECGGPIYAADSVPCPGDRPHETAHRWKAFCFAHAMERKEVATNRLAEIVVCERQGLARVDRGRCGGDCLCPDCGREYRRHPDDADWPFLVVLCDGSAAKL